MKSMDWVLFSVDPVILTFHDGELSVLLVRRTRAPYKGLWGLPGGRVDKKHCPDLSAALQVKLKEKTGLDDIFFEQLATYGSDTMDPRGWSVTTAYLALVHDLDISIPENLKDSIQWWPVDKLTHENKLAFWHARIIQEAFIRLKDKSLYTDLPVNLMPEKFTYPMLKKAYEKILGISISRQSFARRMDDAEIFVDTGERETGSNRPSPLYTKKNRGGAHIFPGLIKRT